MCNVSWSCWKGKFRKVVQAIHKHGNRYCPAGWYSVLDCGHEKHIRGSKVKRPVKGLCYLCGTPKMHTQKCDQSKPLNKQVSIRIVS